MNKLFGILCIFLLFSCFASASQLEINDITAWVDGDKDTMSGGDVDGVPPGAELKIKVEFRNDFTNDEDLDIKNIDVTATLKNIDNEGDDDIDLYDEISRIRADDEDSIEFTFQIPLEVREDTYDLLIEADGKDENGTRHAVDNTYDVTIEKESHELRWFRDDLTSASMCSGLTTLTVGVMNTGSDVEDVVLTARNSELGINEELKFNLDYDPYDSDSKKVSTIDLRIPDGLKSKSYPIYLEATYSSRRISKSVDLIVKCEETTAPVVKPTVAKPVTTTPTQTVKVEEKPVATSNKPDSTMPETQYVNKPIAASSSSSSGSYVALFVLFEVLLVALIVALIFFVKKKK